MATSTKTKSKVIGPSKEVKTLIDATEKGRRLFKLTKARVDNLRYWATELNSGKWDQTIEELVSIKVTDYVTDKLLPAVDVNAKSNQFCCLGVACVLRDIKCIKNPNIRFSLRSSVYDLGGGIHVTNAVKSFFGLTAANGFEYEDLRDYLKEDNTAKIKENSAEFLSNSTFAQMNDTGGWTFGDIAYYIREFILKNSYISG